MSFSTINYKFNGIEEAKLLAPMVEQKFAPLQKLLKPDAAITCEVEFEKAAAHTHGRVYRVEANIFVNKTLFRAEATESSYEEAIDKVRDELDSELSRAKDKHNTLRKRAGRAFKTLLSRS